MSELIKIREKLKAKAQPDKIAFLKNYMTSPYQFTYGLKVPDSRNIAKDYNNLDLYEVYNLFDELWRTGNHEEMSLGIHILQLHRKKFNQETWQFLKPRLEKAKTWDHIDWLATDIVSELLEKGFIDNREIKELAGSSNPWMRRLAIEATYKLIRKNKLELTILLAEKLVYDEDKFVQKGVGWMLREAGKRNRFAIRDFITNHLDMKNIAFSYATEKMKELREERKKKKEEPDYKIYDERPFNFNPKFECVACVVEHNGKILLLHRQDHKPEGNTWGMPGGKMEPKEAIENAIVREIKEETSLNVAKENILFFKKMFVKYKDYDFIYDMFSTKLDKKSEVEINLNEHKAFKWVKPDRAIKMNLIPGLDFCLKIFYNIKS